MKYFSENGKAIVLEAPYCEIYLPMNYFTGANGFATDLGNTISTLGIFNIGFFENGNLKEMKISNVSTLVELYVYDYEVRTIDLPGEPVAVQCKVLKYFKGNEVMNLYVIEDSVNAESYLNFILKGKIPASVPYDKTLELWWKNQQLNGVHLGIPSVILELILAVAYRNKKNPGEKFAWDYSKDLNVSPYDYIMASIRQICQYASTFTALTFEDMDSMISSSLNRTRGKKPEIESPIEKIIKM